MEENRLYIQTELCTSTLQMEMKRNFHIQKKWKLLREMLLALKFIHRNGMVHLDISKCCDPLSSTV
jgi:serine/threonine protein kinase